MILRSCVMKKIAMLDRRVATGSDGAHSSLSPGGVAARRHRRLASERRSANPAA
jgi:hypothetical protein